LKGWAFEDSLLLRVKLCEGLTGAVTDESVPPHPEIRRHVRDSRAAMEAFIGFLGWEAKCYRGPTDIQDWKCHPPDATPETVGLKLAKLPEMLLPKESG
jgi:hypothetical protein